MGPAVPTTEHPVRARPSRSPTRQPAGRWRATALASLVYLVLALGLWWGVWSSHPSTTTTCGCGDAARFLWFFEWPAYALAHGHSIWYSQWLFHPTGINLLNDTSVLALGTVLSPITLAFGPVAAMNVGLTLAPVLSALAMFVLLRRWVSWTPAAFVGGLAYGFSPFLVTELAYNQLNIAFLAVPPVVVLALDELVVRQRVSPYRTGVLLGLLATVEFFVSTEMLLVTALAAAAGMVLVVASTAVRAPALLRAKAAHVWRGLGSALGTATVLLAYPVWFLLRGPAHLTGPIWSNGALDRFGTTPSSFWSTAGSASLTAQMHQFGGYQGPQLPGLGYLGIGAVVVAVAGLLRWRDDRRLQLFGALALVAGALSLAPGHGYWVPWQLARRVPWIADIVEIRFSAVTTLCVSVMVAVVVDRSVARVRDRRARADPGAGRSAGRIPALAGVLVAAIALIPSVVALGPNLPLTTRAVTLPLWYQQAAPSLRPGEVLLAYPAPFAGIQSPMAWQAVNRMHYAMAGGGGPEGVASRAGDARAGFEVLFGASLGLGPAPRPDAANLEAVRHALAAWRVSVVVVPDQPDLPTYDRGRAGPYAVGLFTAALGTRPTYRHSAWVWSSVRHPGSPVPMSRPRFDACTSGSVAASADRLAVADCVLATPR